MILRRFFIFCLINKFISGANILAITTLLSPSHHLFNDVYLFELAKRGHNVTLLGHDEDKHNHPNYTHIIMEGVYEKLKDHFDPMKMKDLSHWETINLLWSFSEITCILDYETEGLRKITRYPDDFKFDLIIWDSTGGQCLFPLVEKFGRPPMIAINPFINQPNTFKNIWQSYIPFMTLAYTDHMSLWQRLESAFLNTLTEVSRIMFFLPRQLELATMYFGRFNLNIEEIERDVSLMLSNHNPVFNYVEALPPNVIPVGGLHIQPKTLPKDLQNILDMSKSGVILFSFGSNIRSKDIGENKIRAIVKTLSKLAQTVIWKFEEDNLPGLSKNVHIRKWLPQNDVLGHANTVLFITHGGLLSAHEAVYNAVPVIGVPFNLDQLQNVANYVKKGIGAKIDFNDITEENLYNVIQSVLNNKSYKENVKKLSVLYKDQQDKPLETAVYWTEYILRHKTAQHLNLATRDMNFLQIANLDIILICLLSVFLLLGVTVTCMCCLILKRVSKQTVTEKIKTS